MVATTLGWWLHPYVSQAFRKWDKQEAAVKRGDDPEAIHQMRVALRRMRAAMGAFKAVFDLPRATRKVGMISRVLGQARDLDVMLARLRDQYLPVLPVAEQAVVAHRIAGLSQQRQGMQRELVALLNSAPYQRVKAAWAEWLEQPRWQPLGDWPVAATLPHLLAIVWGELALHPGWQVDTVATHPELLHDLRKAIKRTRYPWELAGELAEPLAGLQQAQEVLGNLQDGFVLAAQVGTACPTLRQIFSQEQQAHWQAWQSLRAQLQSPTTHQQIYHALITLGLHQDWFLPGDESVHPSAIPLG